MRYYEKEQIEAVPVRDAVGKMLLHDITRIVPDLFKGPEFKKGHIIQDTDVDRLLDLGKQNIFVACLNGEIHENDAAVRLAASAAGTGIEFGSPEEGKVSLRARTDGLLTVDVPLLYELNSLQDVVFATLHTGRVVTRGQVVAGTRVVPLSIDEAVLDSAEAICKDRPVIQVRPLAGRNVGIVVTGSEVHAGRIADGFGPVVQKKLEDLGCRIIDKKVVPDDLDMTVNAIRTHADAGAGMIAVTGGMSVDPDDLTPAAIRAAGGRVEIYGVPVLPGAMFMLAWLDDVPIIGLPGCVMYHKASIFDLVVPRLLAGDRISRADIIGMGHGGLCAACIPCRFPDCPFGK